MKSICGGGSGWRGQASNRRRRAVAGLVLAGAAALAPGCSADGSGPLEEFPASSAAYQGGLRLGAIPVAIAFVPLTVLVAGCVDGWGTMAVIAAPGLPTGVVTGVALATPIFLVEALRLGLDGIRRALSLSSPPSRPSQPGVERPPEAADPAPGSPEPRGPGAATSEPTAPVRSCGTPLVSGAGRDRGGAE